MAFFPCVRFENEIMLWFRGQNFGQKSWSEKQKINYDMQLINELANMYTLVSKMFLVCMEKGIKMIMENPYSQEHFLRRYWCIQPSIIDKDRRERGDYYAKPTQYWFVNCEPENNFIWEAQVDNRISCKDSIRLMNKSHFGEYAKNAKEARSMIHPDYANRFIREFILNEKGE